MADEEFAEFAERKRCRNNLPEAKIEVEQTMTLEKDKDIEKIIGYAKSHCEDRCPAERDPEVCLALIDMCKALDLDPPICFEDTKGFTRAYFQSKIKEIEKRWGKPIDEVLADFDSRGVKTLEENIDKMEAEFALGALKAISARAKRVE